MLKIRHLFTNLFRSLYAIPVSYNSLSLFDKPELNVAQSIYFLVIQITNIKNNPPLIRTGIIVSNPRFDFNGQNNLSSMPKSSPVQVVHSIL